ncbi:MAG: hypothetical protein LBJ21_00545 [Acidobacteriota bacterium]|jgi:hypothetical protein|nr:hypothetical protein [Acidobacteriota bacterium]
MKLNFFVLSAVLVVCSVTATPGKTAELRPETVRAWNDYVASREKQIAAELKSSKGFLAMDFQNQREAAAERRAVLAGEVSVKRMDPAGGKSDFQIPGGTIHHWRGAVFIPDVSFEFAMHRIRQPELETEMQEDVLESRVLERMSPDQYRLFLKLKRTQIITVVYNTEHLVRFAKHGEDKHSSSSVSVKIAEVEQSGGGEREKPEGNDNGFLWRMNSYWRYQKAPGGILVECETITLSRSIPFLLEGLTRPIINSVAGESMERTLRELRGRMVKQWSAAPS